MYDKHFHIIVLDDLMEKIIKSADMQELFTKYCHHKNITTIMVSQNAFQKGPNAHTISLNTHIHILFANKWDESQVSVFANQLFHSKRKRNVFLMYMSCHWDGGDSQGGTRHSLPPVRRRGGFNFDDQLNSSTER